MATEEPRLLSDYDGARLLGQLEHLLREQLEAQREMDGGLVQDQYVPHSLRLTGLGVDPEHERALTFCYMQISYQVERRRLTAELSLAAPERLEAWVEVPVDRDRQLMPEHVDFWAGLLATFPQD